MSEEMIVKHCSPTLAGLKTGNLFSCSYQDRNELFAFLREWNTKLRCKGVRMIPLRLDKGKALIYVYRPSQLSKDLNDVSVCDLLSRCGYCTRKPEGFLGKMMVNSMNGGHAKLADWGMTHLNGIDAVSMPNLDAEADAIPPNC